MEIIFLHKNKHLGKPKLFWTLPLFLTFLLLFPGACKKNGSVSGEKKKEDAGIHESVERGVVTLSLDTDKKEITIAERLNLTISVTIDEKYDYKLPAFGEKLEQFGIVDYHTTQPELIEDNRIKVSRSYVLEPFLSGDYTIPPMTVEFWEKEGRETDAHTIETSEVTINVESLLPEDLIDLKIHDIKPPVPLPNSYAIWLWTGSGASVILIAVFAVIFLVNRRTRKQEGVSELKTPAHILAYSELQRLVEERLVDKGEIKLFYQRVSDIVRRYIENRFGLHAPEQTTEEFLSGLETAKNFPDKYKSLLKIFLKHCDLVKFAEHKPEKEDIQNTFDSCKGFIEGTGEVE
jgi:hypothetical protein